MKERCGLRKVGVSGGMRMIGVGFVRHRIAAVDYVVGCNLSYRPYATHIFINSNAKTTKKKTGDSLVKVLYKNYGKLLHFMAW